MNIAIINVTSNLSTGRIACDLCRVCSKEGHHALLCFSRGPTPPDISSYRVGTSSKSRPRYGKKNGFFFNLRKSFRAFRGRCMNRLNTNIHVLTTRIFDRPGFIKTPFLVWQTRRLIQKLDQFQPDLVHLHNIHGYYIVIPILFEYLRKKAIPVVWTLHDCWSYTGHCAYYSMVKNARLPDGYRAEQLPDNSDGCQRWRSGCGQCPQRHAYPASWFFDRSQKNWSEKHDVFTSLPYLIPVTPSRWLCNEALQSFWAPYGNRFRIIPSGLDMTVFKPFTDNQMMRQILWKYALDTVKTKHMILSVAAVWDERKGMRDLFELSHILGSDYCVVLVGLDENQIESVRTTNDVRKGYVIPLPRTENTDELCALYSAADVYVSASYEETQGMTLLEALACGTQIVCYRATALPETVTHAVGSTVNKGDVDSLAEAVRLLCKNPKDSAACRTRALQYDAQTCFGNYLTLYEQLTQSYPV